MTDEKTPFHNPFAILGRLRREAPSQPSQVASGPKAAPSESKVESKAPAPPVPSEVEESTVQGSERSGSKGRAVVRLERSGRGGKEVTVVEHLAVGAADLESLLKTLKAALGCGGSIEGSALMLQGDQRKRLPDLLSRRGVKKITVA